MVVVILTIVAQYILDSKRIKYTSLIGYTRINTGLTNTLRLKQAWFQSSSRDLMCHITVPTPPPQAPIDKGQRRLQLTSTVSLQIGILAFVLLWLIFDSGLRL